MSQQLTISSEPLSLTHHIGNLRGIRSTNYQEADELNAARAEVEALFEIDEVLEPSIDVTDSQVTVNGELDELLSQARVTLKKLATEQAEELQDLLREIETAIKLGETAPLEELQEELEDFLDYASTNDEV